MNREESLRRYYLNPKICLNCGEIIRVRDVEHPAETRKKKFCSQSCSATYNNRISPKREKDFNKFCPICGRLKNAKAKLCNTCAKDSRSIKNRTLGSYIEGNKYLTSKVTSIRADAKRTLLESGVEKVCSYCHNHEFDEILEVHHVKGILQFSPSSTVEEINSLDNLVWLCPNHHIMLEKGLISL
ncbi:MAG: HNH endonuclease [Spirochaetia bacterium]|nr:HNH endonuclease [Spirochaetia bacterium]